MSRSASPAPPWVRVAFLALAVLAASPAVAYAQAAATDALSARLDAQTATAVQTLIESAVSQGVPGEPLVAKALEGQSKGAAGDRIILAVRNLAADLAAARSALGITAANSEIVAGAGALRSGVSPGVLSRLKAARGNQSVLLPLAMLTDLVSRGIPLGDAVKTVLALADRGASEGDYRAQMAASSGEGIGAPSSSAPAPPVSRPLPGITAPGSPPPAGRPR
jgi:hypothetical protein